MSDWRDELNDAQRRAVDHAGGPLVVLAGPGTGKTRVIIARIRRLIEAGAEPESVLALTFSVRAAEEMRQRLAEAVGERIADQVTASTFHSFGRQVIRRFGDWIGIAPGLQLMDSAQAKRLLRGIIFEKGLFKSRAAEGVEGFIDRGRSFIAACRHAARSPRDAIEYARGWEARLTGPDAPEGADQLAAEKLASDEFRDLAALFDGFEGACLRDGLATFEDFISLPLKIFALKPAAAATLRAEFRHVLVDEFQDVNAAKIEMLRHLAPPGSASSGPDLCVVGDDDQAIYGFRGAHPSAMGRFAEIWKRHNRIALETNYRSAPVIVQATNAVIAAAGERFAPEKSLRAAGAVAGAALEGVIVADDSEIAPVIAAMILTDRQENPKRRWAEYAVLARINLDRDRVAHELELRGIQVEVAARLTPLEDSAVQDVLAWARVLADPLRDNDTRRLLVRPPIGVPGEQAAEWALEHQRARQDGDERGLADWIVGEKQSLPGVRTFGSLLLSFRALAQLHPAERVIKEVIHETIAPGVEALEGRERAARIRALTTVLGFVRSRQEHLEPPGDIGAFLRYYDDLDESEQQFVAPSFEDLDRSEDESSGRGDGVRVITAHGAKGLEFDTVFVARVRPGNGFPHKDMGASGHPLPAEFTGAPARGHADEERRLFYVACTRARRRLVLAAKAKKSRGPAADYYIEVSDIAPKILAESNGAKWIERAGLTHPDESARAAAEGSGEDARERVLRAALLEARQEAFSALHEAENAALGPDAAAGLRQEASRAVALVAAVARLRETGRMPEPVPEGVDAERLRRIAAALSRRDVRPLLLPMKPPLDLSYSAIEEYQRCPRCFYAKNVLGMREPTQTFVTVGGVVHAALERFYRERSDAESDGRAPPDLVRLVAMGEEEIQRRWPKGRAVDRAVLEQVRAQLRMALERFDDDAHALHIEECVRWDYADSARGRHRFVAKMDRVDRLRNGKFRIIDYKTGMNRKTGKAHKEYSEPKKDDLQLCIYALALPHLLHVDGPVSGVAEYWLLATGERGSIDLAALNLSKAKENIDEAIAGMLAGEWPRGKECRGLCEDAML